MLLQAYRSDKPEGDQVSNRTDFHSQRGVTAKEHVHRSIRGRRARVHARAGVYFNKDFPLCELAWWTVPTCWTPCFRGVLARPSDYHAVIFEKRLMCNLPPKLSSHVWYAAASAAFQANLLLHNLSQHITLPSRS